MAQVLSYSPVATMANMDIEQEPDLDGVLEGSPFQQIVEETDELMPDFFDWFDMEDVYGCNEDSMAGPLAEAALLAEVSLHLQETVDAPFELKDFVSCTIEDRASRTIRPLPSRQARPTAVVPPLFENQKPKHRFGKYKATILQRSLIAETFRIDQLVRRRSFSPPLVTPEIEFRQSLVKMQERYLLEAASDVIDFAPTRVRTYPKAPLPFKGYLKRKYPDADDDDEEEEEGSEFVLHPDKRRRINPCEIPSRTLLRALCSLYSDDVGGLVNISRVLDVLSKMGFSFIEGSDRKDSYSSGFVASFSKQKLTERFYDIMTVHQRPNGVLVFRLRPESDPHLTRLLRESEEAEVKNFFKTGCGVTPTQVINWYYNSNETLPTWEGCMEEFLPRVNEGVQPLFQFLKDLYARFSFFSYPEEKSGLHYMVSIGPNERVIEADKIAESIDQVWRQIEPLTPPKMSPERFYPHILIRDSISIPMESKADDMFDVVPTFIQHLMTLQEDDFDSHLLYPITRETENTITRFSRHPFETNIDDNSYLYLNLPKIHGPPRSINRREVAAFISAKTQPDRSTNPPTQPTVSVEDLFTEFAFPYNKLLEREKAVELLLSIIDEVSDEVEGGGYLIRGGVSRQTPFLPALDDKSLIHFIVDRAYPTVAECVEFLSPKNEREALLVRKLLEEHCVIEAGSVVPKIPALFNACRNVDFVLKIRDGKRRGNPRNSYNRTVARMIIHYKEEMSERRMRRGAKQARIELQLRNGSVIPCGPITVDVGEGVLRLLKEKLRKHPPKPSGLRVSFKPSTYNN